MTEIQITAVNADNQIKELYQTAFPVEEQIPWNDLMTLVDRMPLDFTAYYNEGNKLMGFTIVYPRKQFNWFWYFAVPEPLRGKGIGQNILSSLINKYKDCTNILDMESPFQVCANAKQRRQRHAFYSRNGFRDTGVGRSFEGIDYTIMMMGKGTFTMEDYDEILSELRSFWNAMPKSED